MPSNIEADNSQDPNMTLEKAKQAFELKKLEFEKALELRNFEIQHFWNRAWFFGALMVAIATAYFVVGKKDVSAEDKNYQVYLAFLGFIVSVLQSLMNRGSKYWQERWEYKTKNRESRLGIDLTKTKYVNERWLLDAGTLAKNENFLTIPRRFSVTKLTILVWDLLAIAWLLLWIDKQHISFSNKFDKDAFEHFYLPFVSYIILFFFLRRSRFFDKTSLGRLLLKTGGWLQRTRLAKLLKKYWELTRWMRFLRFSAGGGGKVYEGFVRKGQDGETHSTNTDERYFSDSESYVKNDTTRLKYIHREWLTIKLKTFARENHIALKDISFDNGTPEESPHFMTDMPLTDIQRQQLETYCRLLESEAKKLFE